MRILFVAHGFPPRETAGTERHVEALAQHARTRGHEVSVLAATRSAGRAPYGRFVETIDGVDVFRIVNNIPARSLASGESDRAIDAAVQEVVRRIRPDVVHLHHLQFLSSTAHWSAPMVVTLHDQWFWCAAGGLGVLPDGSICGGPLPSRCAPCAGAWRPTPGMSTRQLARAAGLLAPFVSPDRLHRWWRSVPSRLKPQPRRGASPPDRPADAEHRNLRMRSVLQKATTVISPSQHLARRCEVVTGIAPVVVPHGLADDWFRPDTRPQRTDVLFLGTIAAHKGPQHVVAAWRQACPTGHPPLKLHGPVQDARLVDGHPVGPVLDSEGVRRALDRAKVLVMGSTWPENAPLVVLEARARGCLVLAPALGGLPELVGPEDGRLVPAGDVNAMAAALRELLDLPEGSPRPPPRLRDQADRILAVLADAAERP
jgi:glycosyltransferase involved in cell wall biosynthesis